MRDRATDVVLGYCRLPEKVLEGDVEDNWMKYRERRENHQRMSTIRKRKVLR